MRVVDVTTSLAGPYCTLVLGALGADVVKVEHPVHGDEARAWGPAFWEGSSAMFFAANLGKRSLALDVKRPEGVEALLRLAERADVFLQSLRPGRARQLGFGPDAARARNGRLVYCSVEAFGSRGPLREQPGYDPLMQAVGGLISVTGEPDRPGVRAGTSVIDQTTGLWAAVGILAALAEREQTGHGQHVEVALYETALGLLPYQLTSVLNGAEPPRRQGTAFPWIVPYEVFETSDGELMIAAGNDRLFAKLCAVLDLDELVDDPRFRTNPARVANRAELIPVLQAALRAEPSTFWTERLTAVSVPVAPVQDLREVAEHPQTHASGIVQDIAGIRTFALPLSLDGTRLGHASAPPRLGEHTREVLGEGGFSDDEVERLFRDGVVSQVDA